MLFDTDTGDTDTGDTTADDTPASTPLHESASDYTEPTKGEDQETPSDNEAPKEEPKDEEGKKVDNKEKEEENAPEDYSEFTLPEGMEVASETMDEFKSVAKEIGLSQEQAQKLVDLQTKLQQNSAEARVNTWEKTQEQWVEQAKNDDTIGGKDFDANMAVAREGLEKLGNDELKNALDVTGAGNHPAVLKFFHSLGQMVKEDKIELGSNPKNAPRDPAKTLFPNMD